MPEALALSRYFRNAYLAGHYFPYFPMPDFPNSRGCLLACQNRSWSPLADSCCLSDKWRASYGGIDSIENTQAFQIRHSTDGDRIGEVLDLVPGVRECSPQGEARAIRIP